VPPLKNMWQSKLVLLLVLPAVASDVVLEVHWWVSQATPVAIWTIGLSSLLGIVAWKLHSATTGGALTGALITAEMMFASTTVPYLPWQTSLIPILALLILTSIATRVGRTEKQRLGTAESRKGRSAAQVAANLGIAALATTEIAQTMMLDTHRFTNAALGPVILLSVGLAALCEAAADTVSSELGQVLSGHPRMITTLRIAEPGTDGAMSLGGTLAGMAAALLVAGAGTLALDGGLAMLGIAFAGGVFGLFFDSLLGATLERRGWLNNDAVNFLSTLSAAVFALVLLALASR
jgi:uncharacterized protein (TIGR00297 family)